MEKVHTDSMSQQSKAYYRRKRRFFCLKTKQYVLVFLMILTFCALNDLHFLPLGSIYTVILYSCLRGGGVIEKTEIGDHLPDNGRVLVTLRNGKISSLRIAHDDEHLASLKSLFELTELSGFTIVEKDKTKV